MSSEHKRYRKACTVRNVQYLFDISLPDREEGMEVFEIMTSTMWRWDSRGFWMVVPGGKHEHWG